MKRIAVVIDPWDYPFNGTVVSARRFVEALQPRFDFSLLSISPVDECCDPRIARFGQLSIPGFNGIINSMKAPLARPDRQRLREVLAECDLLHVQFPFFLAASAISVARELGKPVVCSFHVQPENVLRNVGLRSRLLARLLYKLFIATIYNRADHVIAPSEFALGLLEANGLIRPASVLSNGVPEDFFELPDRRTEDGRYSLLSVGRLAGEKRHDLIMEAIASSHHRDRICLTVIGAGPREAQLRDKAKALGIDARIGTASDDELMASYASADIFIHAGEIELEGMSVLEAMASGNLVLLSDSSGSAATELVADPEARFDHRAPRQLAGKIDRWLADPDGRRQAAQQNRERARRRAHAFSVTELANIYDRLLGETP